MRVLQNLCVIYPRAGEPESELEPESDPELEPEPYYFFQDPERFKKLEWSRRWSRSWHKLVWLQAPAVFKNFVKIIIFDIILQAKKLIFLVLQ